jgi:hypothetical protein
MPDISTINAVAEDNISEWDGVAAANVASVNGNTWVHVLGNYFGTGADGAVTISANTSLAVTEDTGPVIVNYSTLTVNASTTLTTNNRCKGLVIYVTGDCTINGTVSMTARGAAAAATNRALINIFRNDAGAGIESGTPNTTYFGAAEVMGGDASANVQEFRAELSGGAGGAARNIPAATGDDPQPTTSIAGLAGSAGAAGQSGGGGSGGVAAASASAIGGAGAAGNVYSSGSGGGGSASTDGRSDGGNQGDGVASGGAGGRGTARSEGGPAAGSGGAGNPGGAVYDMGSTNSGSVGSTGTGGLIWLIVGGNLTLGSGGVISADGSDGGNATASGAAAGGGGSGGGRVVVIYAGTLTNNGTIRASGGSGGTAGGGGQAAAGGAGGAGTTEIVQVDT